jgi:ribosomal-protein-alanine N-acetyltransferase
MRAMTQADVDVVLAIELVVQRFPWTRGNFIDALTNGYVCHVDEEGGEIRAYAILIQVLEEAELLNIGVAAGQQRKGLGRAMLTGMLNMAQEKNIRRVFLEVRSSNTAAIALYRSAGFSEIGVRRGYYQNANGSEDALTMACELTQYSSLPQAGERPGERANG